MATYSITQGDLLPILSPVPLTVTDPITGVVGPIDLTTAVSITFIMKPTSGSTIGGACAIVGSPTLGIVSYTWAAGDTDITGTYSVSFKVIWPASKPQTFPNVGYDTIVIQAKLV